MIVKECMTKNVELVTPEMPVYEAARKMRDGDFGILPVQDNDRLVGMLTDRDIAIRCVAEGRDYRQLHVGEVMTEKVLYCFEDQELDEVARNLGDNQIRRLPVLNRQKRLVGILALSDLTQAHNMRPETLEHTMHKISQPGNDKPSDLLF
jgi:CBS domain-containing protein